MFVSVSEIRVFRTRQIEKEQSILREHCQRIHAQMSIYTLFEFTVFPSSCWFFFPSIGKNLISQRSFIDNLCSTLIPLSTQEFYSARKVVVFLDIISAE